MLRRSPFVPTACLFLFLAATPACDRTDDTPTSPVVAASAIAAPTLPAGPRTLAFVIDPTSQTSVDMPAPHEHIKAITTVAAGDLVVDPADLGKTRGQVKVDLTSLTTHTFDNPSSDASQTKHSHNWLEAGDLVTPEVREANRWAIFTLRSVSGLAGVELGKVAVTTRQPGDDTRVVAATVRGDLFVHGHQVPKEVPVEVAFHYPAGSAATAPPVRVDIRTTSPLHVVLAEHDVKPRGSLGKLAKASVALLGKVAETADVTFNLTASPAPPPPASSTARAAPPAGPGPR